MKHPVLDAQTYYAATANQLIDSHRVDDCPDKVDVCVVGAGFTGLSAALELALAGRSVAVFDAGSVAWGASGRNGGQICTGFSPGMDGFEKQLGRDLAQACFDVAEEGKALIRQRVGTYAIECGLTWGFLHAAARASHMAHLEAHGAQLSSYGYDAWHMLAKAEFAAKVASPAYHGGMLEREAGHLHPLNYALGLARAVIDQGGLVFENAPVMKVVTGGETAIELRNGSRVRCDAVVVACNAYLEGLVPGLDHRVMPVASYVIATEPLGEARARAVIRDNEAVSDSNYVVDYFRLSEDCRLIFGGRCSYSGIHPRDLAANMKPRLLHVFPQLEDVAIEFAWGGHIGITHNRLPDVGRVDGTAYYAQGYSGQGVVLTGIMGKLLAEAIVGDTERFDVFSRIRHLPFPGGFLRRPALTAGMLYYRLRDLLS